MKQTPQTIKTLVIAVIIAGILGALTVLAIETIGTAGIKIMGVCLVLIVCGIMATVSLVAAEKPETKNLGMAGIIVAGLVFLLSTVLIVAEVSDAGFLKLVLSLFVLSVGLTHISLLHCFSVQNKYARYARMTATVAISLFTILLITRIFDTFGSYYYESLIYNQSTYKVGMVAFIFDLAATSLVPLCNRLDVPERIEINFEEPTTPVADIQEKEDPAI